jgi:hypothetical protein
LELDSKIEEAVQVAIAISAVFGMRVVFRKRICGSRPPLIRLGQAEPKHFLMKRFN